MGKKLAMAVSERQPLQVKLYPRLYLKHYDVIGELNYDSRGPPSHPVET